MTDRNPFDTLRENPFEDDEPVDFEGLDIPESKLRTPDDTVEDEAELATAKAALKDHVLGFSTEDDLVRHLADDHGRDVRGDVHGMTWLDRLHVDAHRATR
jgi:hypothetical protein